MLAGVVIYVSVSIAYAVKVGLEIARLAAG